MIESFGKNGITKGDMRELVRKKSLEIFAGITVLLAYAPIILWMWDRWFARDSYYSHGVLVPFVTAYLIWQKKDALSRLTPTRSSWGIALIASGILLYILSSIFRVYFTSGFSLLLVLFGLVLHFYGPVITREIAFPLGFLFFMFPLPLVLVVGLSFKMKLFAATIAANVLKGMGIYAQQEGSIIIMRTAYVIVDDVCSGLRSLISLMALGSIFAYWLKGHIIKRVFVFFMTVPIAVVTNVFRIVVICLVAEIWGPQYTVGLVHTLAGLSVFALAFLLLFILVKLLESEKA